VGKRQRSQPLKMFYRTPPRGLINTLESEARANGIKHVQLRLITTREKGRPHKQTKYEDH
jgi:hypothetical protein